MRRILAPLCLAAIACHTDSAVAPPNPGATDAKNMVVGEARVLTPATLPNGIELTPGAATTDYLVVVANASTALDVPATYTVRGDVLSGDAPRAGSLASSGMIAVADG